MDKQGGERIRTLLRTVVKRQQVLLKRTLYAYGCNDADLDVMHGCVCPRVQDKRWLLDTVQL